MPEGGMDRVVELKARVDECKLAVAKAQDAIAIANNRAYPDARDHWRARNAAKAHLQKALSDLRDAKNDLVRVTGTTGSDPRWGLIRDAWRLLNRLEDAGVDLGADGRKLLDDIEMHIPTSKLTE